MNRFKFRCWSDEQKKMYYWSDCIKETNFIYGMFVDPMMLGRGGWIVEQSTGLKDKNGKLIYEGDTLQDCEQKINVVFDEENHCFMFKYQKTHAYKPICCLDVLDGDFEIVGNIHENPELLEEY